MSESSVSSGSAAGAGAGAAGSACGGAASGDVAQGDAAGGVESDFSRMSGEGDLLRCRCFLLLGERLRDLDLCLERALEDFLALFL